jgi:hypothetical protein
MTRKPTFAIGSVYADRTLYASLYQTAETPHAGFAKVIAQDAAYHEDATEFLLRCADGVYRWYKRDELGLVL